MSWNFALILFVLMLVTGVVYALDKFSLRPARQRRVAEALALARPSWVSLPQVEVQNREEQIRAEVGHVPWWVEYGVSFFPVILFVFVLRSFIVEPFRIPSGSMLPTLQAGDLILVNKFTYGLRLPVIDKKIVPGFVGETSNYVLSSSNNLISYVNQLMLWTKETSNIYYSLGNVGIGVEPSQFKLEVARGSGTTPENATIEYGIHTSNYSNIDVVKNITNTDICAKFNSSIWTTGNVISSSDERIKTNIGDVQDDNALRMILNIEPKTYNYIDTQQRTQSDNRVYGFIAQQIRDVIPDAVKIQTEFIPNIFVVADYNPEENIITLPNPIPNPQSNTSRVKCYDMRDTMLIVEVAEVISPTSFKIKNINLHNLNFNINNNFNINKIFVYGTEVNDFHALNKEYINTLNVCAVQELHRKIESQQGEIRELNDKVNVLLNYIDMSKMSALEDEINLLKSRYDLLINYIDLSR